MATLLIHRARCIAAFDHDEPAQCTEWRDASLFARNGQLTTLDQGLLIERHNRLARQLVAGAA